MGGGGMMGMPGPTDGKEHKQPDANAWMQGMGMMAGGMMGMGMPGQTDGMEHKQPDANAWMHMGMMGMGMPGQTDGKEHKQPDANAWMQGMGMMGGGLPWGAAATPKPQATEATETDAI